MASPSRSGSGGIPSKVKERGRNKEKQIDQINRRKMQNRISQQCMRERAQVHSKQLENLANAIKTTVKTDGSGASDMSAQYHTLLTNYMTLLEKNRELNDALLRMRKKMLSVSTASASAADDPIFDHVLQKSSSKKKNVHSTPEENDAQSEEAVKSPKRPPETQIPAECSPSNSNMDTVAPAFNNIDEMIQSFTDDADVTSREMSLQDAPCPTQSASLNPRLTSDTASQDEPGQFFPSYFPYETSIMTQSQPYLNFNSAGTSQRNQDPQGRCNTPSASSAQIWRSDTFTLCPTGPDINSSSMRVERAQKIEEACIRYVSSKLSILSPPPTYHNPLSSCDPIQTNVEILRCAISELEPSPTTNSLIDRVSKIGIDLISRLSGYAAYVYGVGANEFMERVLKWRISPNQQNRMNIPEPFRPTPLQFMSFDHPLAIDFINWPSIRDQLIFKAGLYDLDKMIASIVNNTVIEVPQLRASVNIHDIFVTRVFSYSAATYFDKELDRLFSPLGQSLDGSQEVIRKITQRIQAVEMMEASSNGNMFKNAGNGFFMSKPTPKHLLAAKWGLDKLGQWKLSKEFALSHPDIDCASVTSTFPMFSSSLIPEV